MNDWVRVIYIKEITVRIDVAENVDVYVKKKWKGQKKDLLWKRKLERGLVMLVKDSSE